MRYRNICLFLNLFVCFLAKGQQVFTFRQSDKQVDRGDSAKQLIYENSAFNHVTVNPFSNTTIKTVPSTFYYNSLGFFCRKELQIEHALSFPVKFRLGSVAYTDEMEGKGKGIHLPDKWK